MSEGIQVRIVEVRQIYFFSYVQNPYAWRENQKVEYLQEGRVPERHEVGD